MAIHRPFPIGHDGLSSVVCVQAWRRIGSENGRIKPHIWLDRNAVEVYANEGLVVLTDQIFPDAPINELSISTKSGQVLLNSLHVHALQSIHASNNNLKQTSGRDEA